jgi:esterase/lipase
VFENLNTDRKKLVVYENSKHESLCDKEPAKWRREVAVFLLAGE